MALVLFVFAVPLAAQIATRKVLLAGIKDAQALPLDEMEVRIGRPSDNRNDEIFLGFAHLKSSVAAKKEQAVALDLQRILAAAASLQDENTLSLVYSEIANTLSPSTKGPVIPTRQQLEHTREESIRVRDMDLLRQEQRRAADAERSRESQQIKALHAQGQLIAAEKMRQQLLQSQSNQQLQMESMARRNRLENTLSLLLSVCLLLAVAFAWSLWRMNIARRHQALEDPLTGLKNRRFLSPFMEHETERLRRSGLRALVLIADVDFFKSVNDRWGHDTGDEALVRMAESLRYCVRNSDIITRWGGEEFVIVCPQSTEDHAKVICDRIRVQLMQTRFRAAGGTEFQLTLSIGAALFSPHESAEHWEAALARADKALLEVKRSGRNNWRFAPSALPDPPTVRS